jgi:hypothetical protein
MLVTTIDRNLIDRSQQSKLEFGLDSVRPHARDFGDEFPGRNRPREVNVQSSRTYSSQSGAQQTTLSQCSVHAVPTYVFCFDWDTRETIPFDLKFSQA